MDEKGIGEKELLKLLAEARKRDLRYEEGRILGSMCTAPHPLASKVYGLFLGTNLGDPGLFPGTKELEEEAVRMLGSLLGNEKAHGFVLSGGTEANLMALWAARNNSNKTHGEVIVPETAHFSFEKACDILGLKLNKAEVGGDLSVDVDCVKKLLNKNTVAVVGIAGSTEYGSTDDINALSGIALDEGIHLHVDAAFGGMVLPFLKELGYHTKEFDFSLRGVSSITVDPHKMGLCPVPSGCILFRERDIIESISTASPYLTEKKQYTLTGTRSGASAAATYAVLKLHGRSGYRKVVEGCMGVTFKLYGGLKKLGFEVLEPRMNLVVFSHDRQDLIYERLQKRWAISRTRSGGLRIVVMPHVTAEVVESFLNDVGKV